MDTSIVSLDVRSRRTAKNLSIDLTGEEELHVPGKKIQSAVPTLSTHLVEMNDDNLSELILRKRDGESQQSEMETEKSQDKFMAFQQNMEHVCRLSSIKPAFDSVSNSINCSFASQSDIEKFRKKNEVHAFMGKTIDRKRVKSPTPAEIVRISGEDQRAGVPVKHLASLEDMGCGIASDAEPIEING